MSFPVTRGVHHVGLTVTDLDASSAFFTELLEWDRVGGDPDYPAVFVSDGSVMVTLWRAREPATAAAFDNNNAVGLHHLALEVADLDMLDGIYRRLAAAENVAIEVAPEPLRGGPAVHMMCREPAEFGPNSLCLPEIGLQIVHHIDYYQSSAARAAGQTAFTR